MGLLRKPANCKKQEYYKVAALRTVDGLYECFCFSFLLWRSITAITLM